MNLHGSNAMTQAFLPVLIDSRGTVINLFVMRSADPTADFLLVLGVEGRSVLLAQDPSRH